MTGKAEGIAGGAVVAGGGAAAAGGGAAAAGVRLRGAGGKRGVAVVISYERRMEDYADRYGAKLRTVKRWAALGREAGDPCPLDDAEAMPGWWSRRMKHRVPPGIWAAAGGDVAPPVPVAVVPVDDLPTGRGVEAEMERLEHLSARLSVKAAEPGQTKAYLDSIQRMTSLQKQVREEAEKARRLLPRDEVEQALHDLHGPIEREMRLMLKTMADGLGVPVTPEVEARWNRELDALFLKFQGEIFR